MQSSRWVLATINGLSDEEKRNKYSTLLCPSYMLRDSTHTMAENNIYLSSISNELARTIRVFGLPAWVDTEELQNFFENSSIGGPIVIVTIHRQSKKAEIVFEQVRDAEKVACTREFIFKNIWLTVEKVNELHPDMMTEHSTSSHLNLPAKATALPLPDLQCGCSEPWYSGYFFDDVHLGFICQACLKEWLWEELVPLSDEPSVCHDGKRYLSPKIKTPEEFKSDGAQCQVTTSRKRVEPLSAAHSLKPGDHIMWHRPWLIWHHAIVESMQDDIVNLIHFSKDKSGTSVMMSEAFDFTKECGTLYKVVYSEEVCHKNPVELVLARARALLGITDYHLFNKNCENFATFCKTGNNTNQQSKWFFKQLKETLQALFSISSSDIIDHCVQIVCTEVFDLEAEYLELTKNMSGAVDAGVVFVIEGFIFICNLEKLYRKRKEAPNDGTLSLSREEFISEVIQELSIRFFGSVSAHVLRHAICIPGIGPVMGCIFSLIGGYLSLTVGKTVGRALGPVIARTFTKAIETTDESVPLEKLQPGDHVVFYGNQFHPRCHAIVSEVNKENGTLIVIRSSYNHGSVIYHKLSYKKNGPIFKVFYCDKTATYSADEIIRRAEEAAGDHNKYNILFNNCKDFVYSITLRC